MHLSEIPISIQEGIEGRAGGQGVEHDADSGGSVGAGLPLPGQALLQLGRTLAQHRVVRGGLGHGRKVRRNY